MTSTRLLTTTAAIAKHRTVRGQSTAARSVACTSSDVGAVIATAKAAGPKSGGVGTGERKSLTGMRKDDMEKYKKYENYHNEIVALVAKAQMGYNADAPDAEAQKKEVDRLHRRIISVLDEMKAYVKDTFDYLSGTPWEY